MRRLIDIGLAAGLIAGTYVFISEKLISGGYKMNPFIYAPDPTLIAKPEENEKK